MAGLLAAPVCLGQTGVLLADRTADTIWLLKDANGDGIIDNASELSVFYSGANAQGTPAPLGPNVLAVRLDGLILVGDNDAAARRWLWLRDLNHDGDAMDIGESGVFADAANAAGVSFASPSGGTFLRDGRALLINAGTGAGSDAVFLAADGNADGDAQDAGEVGNYVTVNGFGTGNGSYSPQEIIQLADGTRLLRNSSSGLNGVFKLQDDDASGTIDAAGEFTTWWGAGNADGVAPTAGLDINVNPFARRSVYIMQVITGAIDQLYRVTDVNGDGDAMDLGETVLVYSTAETGFTGVDTAVLADGSLLVSENSGPRVIRLRDLNNDGLFTGEGERADFYASGPIQAARAMVLLPSVCGLADVAGSNQSPGPDAVLTADDIIVYLGAYFSGSPLADIAGPNQTTNPDGLLTADDIIVYLGAFFAGC